jgi:hypothetical protein
MATQDDEDGEAGIQLKLDLSELFVFEKLASAWLGDLESS